MRNARAWAAGAVTLLLASFAADVRPALAQGYFGQNQVQYDEFKWRVIETEHFLVHYYPEERTAAADVARMAERSYARLSRLLDHQFREKKPVILFASRADFGQNNITGDLGEGTGGVTDALRQRNIFFMPGDYRGTEHVLTHEMVHQFQYDIFSRGKAGANLQALSQANPPLWLIEGMAEYLSIGPDHPFTDTWIRDAALNGTLPTIEQMTLRPDRFFPYRFGEAVWEYVGARWGDEVIGQIMNAIPSIGVERAFKREIGLSLEELSEEWREAMQTRFLPQVAELQRARRFAQPLLSERRSGGQIFLAPALSDDGKYVAFLSNGSFLRGQVFIDLWLGDAKTGKRIERLVKSTTNNDAEELQILYSQSAFSPDGSRLAYTGLRKGKEVLYLLDVKRRKQVKRFDLPVENVQGPSFSPDGRRLVFSGGNGGISDLYIVDVDGRNLRRLTNDRHADLQPQWSPDGRTIAFASDRGTETDFGLLRFSDWQLALLDVESGAITVPEGQDGLNINPQWAPDSRSIAYVSDRAGTPNVFLYDRDRRDHFQLTNVVGGILSITETTPVLTWAKQADRMAFVYFEGGDYTVWSVDNPRLLRKQPYREPAPGARTIVARDGTVDPVTGAPLVATAPEIAAAVIDTTLPRAVRDSLRTAAADSVRAGVRQRSYYRTPAQSVRISADLSIDSTGENGGRVAPPLTVASLLDSVSLALPDTTRFRDRRYRVNFQPEFVSRPSVGVAQSNFGRGVYGGTTIVLSDLVGNNRLAFSGQVNGRVSEAQLFVGYTNLGSRLQHSTGAYQLPYFFLSGRGITPTGVGNVLLEEQAISRFLVRQAYGVALYPLNRFTRFEFGGRLNNIDRSLIFISRQIDGFTGASTRPVIDSTRNFASLNYVQPSVSFVSDNALFGYTGPIMGRRMRFSVEQTLGSWRWLDYLADYRRYDPILFNFLTVATRASANIAVGRDEAQLPKCIGYAQSQYWVRGYVRGSQFTNYGCGFSSGGSTLNNQSQLLGSRVAVASAELRFPVIRRIDLGILPISLPPLDGLLFYDAGVAWYGGQSVSFRRPPATFDPARERYLLTSYGAGLRLNLFNFALVRFDYAIPTNVPGQKGFWTFSLGPSF